MFKGVGLQGGRIQRPQTRRPSWTSAASTTTAARSRSSSRIKPAPPPPPALAACPRIRAPSRRFANLMSELQQLQQNDPTKFKAVMADIASTLKTDAQNATGSQASALNNLAAKFDQAAQTGQMPNLQRKDSRGQGTSPSSSPCAKLPVAGCGRHALGCLRQLFTAGAIQSGPSDSERAANGWREPEPVANARATLSVPPTLGGYHLRGLGGRAHYWIGSGSG